MYSFALTTRHNEAMRKKLKEEDQSIQAHGKYPVVLMVKLPGETAYT